MAIDLTNFLDSLAFAMAAAAGNPAIVLGRDLFVSQAIEATAGKDAPVYGVMRIYGGPKPVELLPVPWASVQVMATCSRPADAMNLAQRLFQSLYVDINAGTGGPKTMRPRGRWMIAAKSSASGEVTDDASLPGGWEIRVVELQQTPGTIGRDERGKTNVVFNFEVKFEAKEA